jgi:hypothetical protein
MTSDANRSAVPEPDEQIRKAAQRLAHAAPPIGPNGLKRLRELLQPVKGHAGTRKSSADSTEGASG